MTNIFTTRPLQNIRLIIVKFKFAFVFQKNLKVFLKKTTKVLLILSEQNIIKNWGYQKSKFFRHFGSKIVDFPDLLFTVQKGLKIRFSQTIQRFWSVGLFRSQLYNTLVNRYVYELLN